MTSGFSNQQLKRLFFQNVKRPQTTTLVLLSLMTCISVIMIGWLSGEANLTQVFSQLHYIQQNPPFWLEVPPIDNKYLLIPTAALGIIVFLVMKISPQPQLWSQIIVVSVLLALTLRYLLWRSLSTLNLADPLNGFVSLTILAMEMLVISGTALQLYHSLKIKKRHREADRMSVAVIAGKYTPSVDILVPTYNEPVPILRRSIMGCQAIDYPHKTVYLLDDKRRPEMKQLAQELGCEYITRPDNLHAKAGNLNHAIAKTHGELIVVFDADFVPMTNFLTRTVGFFQKVKTALVQTHQSFYNPDPIARNLGLEEHLLQDVETFYRHYEFLRDATETTMCTGSAFIVRRSALVKTGGFVTESVTEDYFTGVRLCANGYQIIYLGESLSAGLSPENIAGYISQRVRWARGSAQAFFIPTNPMTIPGLNWKQRLFYLEGILQWFLSGSRLLLLVLPVLCYLLRLSPIQTNRLEVIYFFLPYYVTQIITFSWLSYRSRSAFISDIYSIIQCVPVSMAVLSTLFSPFSKKFKVTPKGTSSHQYSFNFSLALPLILILISTIICFSRVWHQSLWIIVWSVYNIVMISVSLIVFLDVPKPSVYEWFKLRRVVRVEIGDEIRWGITTKLSEMGAEITINRRQNQYHLAATSNQKINIELTEENLNLTGTVTHDSHEGEFTTLKIQFDPVTLSQHRQLVQLLFCRPGQWKSYQMPGEFKSILLLFKALIKPRFLFERHREDYPTLVSQS